MKKYFSYFAISVFLLLIISCKNKGKNICNFDKIPLDTTKWGITGTIKIDLNKDGIDNAILIFNKYRALSRPNGILVPLIFYLGTKDKKYVFINKAEKIIFSPYFKIKKLNNEFYIEQDGMGNDYNIYITHFKYDKGNIIGFKELIVQKIEKGKIDESTGEVITTSIQVDTIFSKDTNILVDKYDFNYLLRKKKNTMSVFFSSLSCHNSLKLLDKINLLNLVQQIRMLRQL